VQITTVLVLALLSGFVAAVSSFLIFYEEYTHHFPDKKKAFKTALHGAIMTFVVFAIAVFIALFFLRMAIL
jgi:hypothetical protein